MFLCAKSASAATAALGLAGYLLSAVSREDPGMHVPVALTVVVSLTLVILSGMRRTNRVNTAIVSMTLFSLSFFVLVGLPSALRTGGANLAPLFGPDAGGSSGPLFAVLHATALMFVAYTGYGRIATLGEEVRDPRRTIPRAIIATLMISMVLYMAVGTVSVASVGAASLYAATTAEAATLETVAKSFGIPGAPWVLAAGALSAMGGVLLNLILGLSRVLLAMGRRLDMPSALARLDRSQSTPYVAVIAIGALVAGLVLLGSVRTTWSFSAFTVLVYYAITNLCALRMPEAERLYPRWVAAAGLIACLSLAFFVETTIWVVGIGLILLSVIWHLVARRLATA